MKRIINVIVIVVCTISLQLAKPFSLYSKITSNSVNRFSRTYLKMSSLDLTPFDGNKDGLVDDAIGGAVGPLPSVSR
jgi:hypothetical protein